MADLSDRAPDQIEPIIGYRAWYFNVNQGRADLLSLAHFGLDWLGATRGWVTASCAMSGRHQRCRVPVEECTCGFYAMNAVGPVIGGVAIISQADSRITGHTTPIIVLGRVELAGKVIEHEYGYRAERARIVQLIPIRGSQRLVRTLASRLDVPLGRPITLQPFRLVAPAPARTRQLHPRKSKTPAPEPSKWSAIRIAVICLLGLLYLIAFHAESHAEGWGEAIVMIPVTLCLAIAGGKT